MNNATPDTIATHLSSAARTLEASIPLTWRLAPKAPANPITTRINPRWPVWVGNPGGWDNTDAMRLRKNADNWLYCEFTFPRRRQGIDIAGDEALIFIYGWCPFTLWLDGKELFADEHIWKASGPIGDPVIAAIEPGRTHRLVVCLRPTELSESLNPCQIQVVPRRCLAQAIELSAAGTELTFADALATNDRERALIAEAASRIDLASLSKRRWSAVNAAIVEMERVLAPFSERAKAHTVHLAGHSHIDMDWQWTWTDTEHCILRDFKAAADLLKVRDDVTFSMSQIPSYDTIRRKAPALFKQVKQLATEGRWENLASTWVEGDLSMADGESLARHFLYAQNWSAKHLGDKSRVFFGPDTFGHPGNMPQLARLGGCDVYFHWRCNPGGEGADSWPVRRWHGADGSDILALSCPYGGGLTPGTGMHQGLHEALIVMKNADSGVRLTQPDVRVGPVACHAIAAEQRRRMSTGPLTHSLHIWGLGDHGGGINHHKLWCLEQYRDKPLIPTFVHDTIAGYADAVSAHKDATVPANNGETYLIFKGCYTTQARIKRYNRKCEGAMLAAESLCALAGLNRNAALRDAWTPVLFNQFHDIFDGASVPDAYADAYARAERSLKTAGRIQKEALGKLAPASRSGCCITVLNPLGFARDAVINVPVPKRVDHLVAEDGAVLPVQHNGKKAHVHINDLPAFGTATLSLPQHTALSSRGLTGKARCLVDIDTERSNSVIPSLPRDLSPIDWLEIPRYARNDRQTCTVSLGAKPRELQSRNDASQSPKTVELTITTDTHSYTVENTHYRARVARNSGIIASYVDKTSGRELVACGTPRPLSHIHVTRLDMALNVFQVIDESPNAMTAWHIHDIRAEQNLVDGATVEVVEQGPVCARLRVTHTFRQSRIIEDILFYADSPRIEFDAEIDWREPGNRNVGIPQLKVGFAARLTQPRLRYEGPFVVGERTTDGMEKPTQKWVALTGNEGGFAVYNDGRYGYDALGGRIRLSLLRTSYTPDPQSDQGTHHVRFAFEPHAADMPNAELVRRSMAFNRPALVQRTDKPSVDISAPFSLTGAPGVVCTALRRAEHSDALLLRLFECNGKRARGTLKLDPGIRTVEEVDFLERPVKKPRSVKHNACRLTFRPFEVKTLRLVR